MPPALSVPASEPAVVGAKVTLIVQEVLEG